MHRFRSGSLLAVVVWSSISHAQVYNFGEQSFTVLETQASTPYVWDTGDLLIANFDVSGRVGSISGSRNALVVPEVKFLGNTIVPEVRRDTRSGLRFTGALEGYAGAVLSAGLTLGGGDISGAIGMGPQLTVPDQVRAGQFFAMQGTNLVNHTTSSFDLALPTLSAGMDLAIGGSGSGTIEYGLYPFTGYKIGNFDFNLPDIRLPVFNIDFDLNLPRLPDFGFLDIPDLVPESDKDTALFRQKLPPGNPLLSAGEVVLDNPSATAESVTRVDGSALTRTTTGDIARIGVDIDGILSFAATGVSFTGLEATVGKLATVKYDTVDVKYGIELGYEVENRIDSRLEVNLKFVDPVSGNPLMVLMRDASGVTAADSYTGQWDQLPEIAFSSDQDVDVQIDFTGIKRILGQKGSLTLSDYMELKVLAASAKIKLGPGIELGPLLYKKFDLAGELAAFEIYDETVTLTDIGLIDGLWDDTIRIDVIENTNAYLASASAAFDQAADYRRLDNHTPLTTLLDKTLAVGTAMTDATTRADILPVDFVDTGATVSTTWTRLTGYTPNPNPFGPPIPVYETLDVDLADAATPMATGGLYLPAGSSYTLSGARRIALFSIENNGIIENHGRLDIEALNSQLVIGGEGTLYFGAKDATGQSASGLLRAEGLIHGAGHTIDFGPAGSYRDPVLQALLNGGWSPVGSVADSSRAQHVIDVTGTLQNLGTLRVRGSSVTIGSAFLINDSSGLISVSGGEYMDGSMPTYSVGNLTVSEGVQFENRGRVEASTGGTLHVHADTIIGGSDGPGVFSASGGQMQFTTPAASVPTAVTGQLDFIAGDGGQIAFDRTLVIAGDPAGVVATNVNLATSAGGTLTLNGLLPYSGRGTVTIDNQGLLDIVSGLNTLRIDNVPNTPGDPVATISPIDLRNTGTVRVHGGAQFGFDVDIVNYAEGGAAFNSGTWELLGANERFANTDALTSAHTGLAAVVDVRVNQVFAGADRFSDLVFDEVYDASGNLISTSGINNFDTRLIYNDGSVTLSGVAKFDYFNTVAVNRGTLRLLNQHQFHTAESFENRGGLTQVETGAGLHVNGALRVNGGSVNLAGNAEFSVAGMNEVLDDGSVRRHDIEVNGGALNIAEGTLVDSGLVSRSRTDGLLLQSGRSWIVRDSVVENADGSETVTPGVINLGIRTSNGVAGVVRNNADVVISGRDATFAGFESTLRYQHGSLTIADGKVFDSPNSYFRNANEMTLSGGQFLLRNGEFRNDGNLTVDPDSYLGVQFLNLLTGTAEFQGAVEAEETYINSQVDLTAGLLASGLMTLGELAQFSVLGGTILANAFDGSLSIDGGVFAPGLSIGTTSILGDYTQGIDGTLAIEWGMSGADFVDISNIATLAGVLQIDLLDGFMPEVGDSIQFLTAGSITDGFDLHVHSLDPLNGMALVLRQESNGLFLDVVSSPVPLPAAVWLFGAAIGLLGSVAHRWRYRR